MNIPKTFVEDIHLVRKNNRIYMPRMIKRNKTFIQGLANHSLRYRHPNVIWDKDDMFQEACYWLIFSVQEWNEEKGTTLEKYVVYNIGVRLSNLIKKELAKKRFHYKYSIEIPRYSNDIENSLGHIGAKLNNKENEIDNINNIEEILNVKKIFDVLSKELTSIQIKFLGCLIESEGNVREACKIYLSKYKINKKDITQEQLRQFAIKNILPNIRTKFSSVDIIN